MQIEIADRFRDLRLAANLSQEELATRSGVSWGSLKRFERYGLIALDSLLKIALVLGCMEDFDTIANRNLRIPAGSSLDEILAVPKTRRRATSRKGGR